MEDPFTMTLLFANTNLARNMDTMVPRRQTITVCISWSLKAAPEQIIIIRQVLTRPGNAFSFLAHGQCWFGVKRVLQIAHHNPTALQSNLSRMSSGTSRTL